jgi:hypothetical protein
MKASILCTVLIAATTQVVSIDPSHGEPAHPTEARKFDGVCSRFEIAQGVVKGACRSDVASLRYSDGFTSVQFHATDQKGSDTETVTFIGPRWTQVDDTRAAMVIDQIMVTQPRPKSLAPVSASGFCLYERKAAEDPVDKPVRIYCEYNTRNSARIFVLDDVSSTTSGPQ